MFTYLSEWSGRHGRPSSILNHMQTQTPIDRMALQSVGAPLVRHGRKIRRVGHCITTAAPLAESLVPSVAGPVQHFLQWWRRRRGRQRQPKAEKRWWFFATNDEYLFQAAHVVESSRGLIAILCITEEGFMMATSSRGVVPIEWDTNAAGGKISHFSNGSRELASYQVRAFFFALLLRWWEIDIMDQGVQL